MARFRFTLPEGGNSKMSDLTNFLKMSLYFVDHVATSVRLPQQVREEGAGKAV